MKYTTFGKTGLTVSRLALGGAPCGYIHQAAGWNPYEPEGRKKAIQTVHCALEAGINYIDTAPAYGADRHSEKLIGEALLGRRDAVIVADKVSRRFSPSEIRSCVEASLLSLRTDWIDILQFHGSEWQSDDVELILHGGPLDMLEQLKAEGKIRLIGFTAEYSSGLQPLVYSGRFDMVQLTYNVTNMRASNLILDHTQKAGIGVTAMRPLTSGALQRIASLLLPQCSETEVCDFALKFALSDSRVHVIDSGMRFPEEIVHNVRLMDDFQPSFDMATFPRLMLDLYRTDDENKGWKSATGVKYLGYEKGTAQ
jgi:aryl-alcohol dehydrogenase-like predicted oxidoreductase